MNFKKIFISCVIVLVFWLLVRSCSTVRQEAIPERAVIRTESSIKGIRLEGLPSTSNDGSLEVTNAYLIERNGRIFVKGTMKNHSDRMFSPIEIYFNIYDKGKNLIGTADDSIVNFEGKGTWSFEAMSPVKCIDTLYYFKLMEFKAW